MDLASPAVSGTSVYANGLTRGFVFPEPAWTIWGRRNSLVPAGFRTPCRRARNVVTVPTVRLGSRQEWAQAFCVLVSVVARYEYCANLYWLSRNTNKMQLCNRIYYSKVYWRLNMFQAAHRSSSGAINCICSLWFIYTCGDRPLSSLIGISHSALTRDGRHMCI